MRESRNVSASVFLRRADRRLSKAVSAWFGELQEAGCRATAATGTCGECCRAWFRSDLVAGGLRAREKRRKMDELKNKASIRKYQRELV